MNPTQNQINLYNYQVHVNFIFMYLKILIKHYLFIIVDFNLKYYF